MAIFEPPLKQYPLENGQWLRPWWMWFTAAWQDIVALNSAVVKNTTRITSADSPYTILSNDDPLICDTDGGAITVNLLAGTIGDNHTIKNAGSSGNNVTVVPAGSDTIEENTIYDAEYLDLVFETTENWVVA